MRKYACDIINDFGWLEVKVDVDRWLRLGIHFGWRRKKILPS